ncbi:unnamed protein product [Schistocephalus solidus]|uniref:P-type domain-containing protein n=1 Tax=Schistocephalus solidus TaxID=70667 RepID=A0A183TQ67_SCHSO|nr:unnamed protein product [Schistocephalus solidus]
MTVPKGLLCALLVLITCVSGQPDGCSSIPTLERMDCHPERSATEETCLARGCCWEMSEDPEMNACYLPVDYPAYSVQNTSSEYGHYSFYLQKQTTNPQFANELAELRVDFVYETPRRLRLRITDPHEERWEPPVDIDPPKNFPPKAVNYRVSYDSKPFGFKIYRKTEERGEDHLLIDSSGPLASSLMASNRFWQIAFKVAAQRGFGPGERRTEFPLRLRNWERAALWVQDHPPMEHANLYGVHNFFLGLAVDGTAFGIFLLNSNAQEIAFQPMPSLTYRTIGGILDFFIFMGPQPLDVISQYLDLIGRPPLPPYWALGFHLCRYAFRDLADVEATVSRNRDANVPLEVLWVDIDFMDGKKDWTVDPMRFAGVGQYIRETIHSQNDMRTVIMFDAAIQASPESDYEIYWDGLSRGVYINDSRTGEPIKGRLWPGTVVYPDYGKQETVEWVYDGASNWDNQLDHPPYQPRILDEFLYSKTICPSALHENGSHFDLHNLYGYMHAKATRAVLQRLMPGQRPFVLSRSTFAGSGRYTYHYTGSNSATWDDLAASIPQMLNFNIFGIPMVGADICGFMGNTTEELCIRWSQLGAFYPFSRNHNAANTKDQDPASWGDVTLAIIRETIELRYSLLPYLYSLLYRAKLDGKTVVRALALEYPKDLACHSIDKQFLWGSCLLITPVLEQGARGVYGYLPQGQWIGLRDHLRHKSKGEWFYFEAPLEQMPLHVKAGCVLPMHVPAQTINQVREIGIGIWVVLKEEDQGYPWSRYAATAWGELFWDDGLTETQAYTYITFTVVSRRLTILPRVVRIQPEDKLLHPDVPLAFIKITGISRRPKAVNFNQERFSFSHDVKTRTLLVEIPPNSRLTTKTQVSWSF